MFKLLNRALGREMASGHILRNLARSCGVSRELACQASQSADLKMDPG